MKKRETASLNVIFINKCF